MASVLPTADGWTRTVTGGSLTTEEITGGELRVVTAVPVNVSYEKTLKYPSVKWGTYYGKVRVVDPTPDGIGFRFGFAGAILEFEKVGATRRVVIGSSTYVIDWRTLHEYRVVVLPAVDDTIKANLYVDESDIAVISNANPGSSTILTTALMGATNSTPAGVATEFKVTNTRFASRIAGIPSRLPFV